jgi:hypothetical protein
MMEILSKENEKEWENFAGSLEETFPQHLNGWMNAVAKTYKNCEPVCYMDAGNGKTNAIFPFFMVKSRIFGDRIISQPFTDFGGPMGNFDGKFMHEIMEDLKKKFGKNSRYIEIRLNTSVPSYDKIESCLAKEGFEKEQKRHQFILELKSEEELWNSFTRITKKGIKKAMKSELVLSEINNEKELQAFYGLYLKSMRNFGTPQHSHDFFANLMECMKGDFRGLNCYKNGNLIGSLIVFCSKNYMYAAYNFSEHDSLVYQPNDMLYWEMIKWASKRGVKFFDFGQCETNAPEGSHAAGIYKFKSKWNGIPYERPYFRYSFEKSVDKGSGGNEKFKKMIGIWKKLPPAIIKKIGPKIASELGL